MEVGKGDGVGRGWEACMCVEWVGAVGRVVGQVKGWTFLRTPFLSLSKTGCMNSQKARQRQKLIKRLKNKTKQKSEQNDC